MKPYIILILSLFILVFTACEDVIEVPLSEENLDLFAVEANITTENNAYVYFYKSIRVDNDEAYPGISGAIVTISDNNVPSKSMQLVENSSKNGYYSVPENEAFLGEVGKEYTVTIQYEGISIAGKDKLERVEPIDSIQVRPSLRGDKRFMGIFTYGNETPGLGNYYKWDIYINDTLLSDSEYLMFASDELVDGNYIESFEVFTDFHDINKPEDRKLLLGDSILVKQTSISQQAYLFYYQMYDQSMTGSMFSVPPANIKGNFTASDGKIVLGIFTANDVSTSNIAVIDETIESQLDER